MEFEIRKVRNGFCIFIIELQTTANYRKDPWVFETLEGALKFLRDRYEKEEATCGSCFGSGFIK